MSYTEIADSSDALSDTSSSNSSFCEDSDLQHQSALEAPWKFTSYRSEGRVSIFGEWVSRTKYHRCFVIGPDWPCVIMTYVVIIIPSIFVSLYLLDNLVKLVIFFITLSLTILGLTAVFLADPGLLRNYHHARTRQWTFCDHCESFRPPGSVHCSTCQVCIAGYDHHCPWTGKCVGKNNVMYFKIFVVSLSCLVVLDVVLGVLQATK